MAGWLRLAVADWCGDCCWCGLLSSGNPCLARRRFCANVREVITLRAVIGGVLVLLAAVVSWISGKWAVARRGPLGLWPLPLAAEG